MNAILQQAGAGLYPSTLFHFTKVPERLFGILRENFKVRYSLERVKGPNRRTAFGAPMVSFCDLRLSELRAHMLSYGNYGIGLSKEWANRSGLNTVYYISAHAEQTDLLISGVEDLYAHVDGLEDLAERENLGRTYMGLMNIYRYVKNYEGRLVRADGTVIENYRFANEREWRFVPPIEATPYPFASEARMANIEERAKLEDQFDVLYFEPADIRYIIVEREDERDSVIDIIGDAKTQKYGPASARLLASRILTAEQIYNDV